MNNQLSFRRKPYQQVNEKNWHEEDKGNENEICQKRERKFAL